MLVQQVAAQVNRVLAHAESLFAEPGGGEAAAAALARLAGAAEDSRAVTAEGGALAGGLAAEHAALADAATQRLAHGADADAALAQQVSDTAAWHAAGRKQAGGLRAAAEVPERLQPWADVPAGEAAALRALRARVAGMQQLIRQQGAAAARAGADVRAVRY